jgi:hypothetical protein
MIRPPLLKNDGGIQLVLEDSRQDELLVHDRQARPFHLDKEERHNGKNTWISIPYLKFSQEKSSVQKKAQ